MSSTAPPAPLPVETAPPLPAECLPNYDLIVTEDDTPVDNIHSERQAKLLSDSLYASWSGPGEGRPFVAMGNVGLFFAVKQPPLVPDFLVSLDVEMPDDAWPKENRSYFIWNYGKAPDLVAEFVSNTEGGEADTKRKAYARIGIPYYVIFDPLNQLRGGVLQVFALRGRVYEPVAADFLPVIGLGLKLWQGTYAGMRAEWLRWCDHSGKLLLTGEESAIQERQRADQEQQRAHEQEQRAEEQQRRAHEQKQRADRLAAQLRSLGVEPTE
jgi:Uma2 family endonuclease